MNIPQVLGYTRIAGTPIVTGLYTLVLPLVAFAAFGSSRYLVVAADSATAAILSGGLVQMAKAEEIRTWKRKQWPAVTAAKQVRAHFRVHAQARKRWAKPSRQAEGDILHEHLASTPAGDPGFRACTQEIVRAAA